MAIRVVCPYCAIANIVADDDAKDAYCCKCGHQFTFAVALPIDQENSFVWWRDRAHGHMFPYQCRGCPAVVQLRMRVTQSDRECPNCQTEITISGIDAQLSQMEKFRQEAIDLEMAEAVRQSNAAQQAQLQVFSTPSSTPAKGGGVLGWIKGGAAIAGVVGLGIASVLGAAYLEQLTKGNKKPPKIPDDWLNYY